MVNLERFEVPDRLEEALRLLAGGREAARALAGGTSLIFFRGKGTAALVDITRLGLDGVTDEGDVWGVGACERLQRLADAPALAAPGLRALSEAAAVAGPRPVRNAVTLGGNVVGYKRWSDTPAALIALSARAEVAAADQAPREIPVRALFTKHPQTVLAQGELVTRFRIPKPAERSGSAYVKFARTRIDYALASAAARVTLDEAGACTDALLVLGAVERLPRVVTWAGETLQGTPLSDHTLADVAGRIREETQPVTDMRASADYLAELAGVVATDALRRAVAHARGEQGHA